MAKVTHNPVKQSPQKKAQAKSSRFQVRALGARSLLLTDEKLAAKLGEFKRAELVGKFPGLQHLSAPKAKRKLDSEQRKQLLAAMSLA